MPTATRELTQRHRIALLALLALALLALVPGGRTAVSSLGGHASRLVGADHHAPGHLGATLAASAHAGPTRRASWARRVAAGIAVLSALLATTWASFVAAAQIPRARAALALPIRLRGPPAV